VCSLAPYYIHSFSLSSSSPHRHRHRHRQLVVLQPALSLGLSKKKIQKYHHHHGWYSITSNATSKPRHLHVFSPFQQEEETSSSSPSPAAAAVQDDNQKNDDNDNDGMTTLHFCAKQTFTSEPIAISSSSSIGVSNHLARFLIDESNEIQNLLLGGGTGTGTGTANLLPLKLSTNESILLLDEWKKQAQMVGAQLPNVQKEEGQGDDAVYQVKTGGINFAGLRVQSNALIGVKLVTSDMVPANCSTGDSDGYSNDKDEYEDLSHYDDDDDDDSPCLVEYQLVYIKDEQYVDGPRVLVWIFNKLTGKNSNTGSGNGNSGSSIGSGSDAPSNSKQQSVSSFSRFYVNITNDKMAIFKIESMLDIAIKFPTFLLKILPVSKEKAEEQGSASVMKTLVKDTGASLQRVVDYYKQVALME